MIGLITFSCVKDPGLELQQDQLLARRCGEAAAHGEAGLDQQRPGHPPLHPRPPAPPQDCPGEAAAPIEAGLD